MKKCLLHIPKNAGTTIRKLFDPHKPVWQDHACLQAIKDQLGTAEFKRLQFIAIVRNPYQRLYSWHKYHRMDSSLKEYKCSFSEWMDKWCPHHWTHGQYFGAEYGLRYNAYLYAPTCQKNFLLVDGKVPKNVRIIRMEELESNWESICEFYGKSLPMRQYNRSASKDEWRKHFTGKTKDIANKLCSVDLQWTNYEL